MKHPFSSFFLVWILLLCSVAMLYLCWPTTNTVDLSKTCESASPICFNEQATSLNFSSLSKYLDGKDIVILGESRHDDGTTIKLKGELVKYLHDSLDFNILLFEAGYYDMNCLSRELINGRLIKPEAYLWPFWSMSEESRPLWQYIMSTYEKSQYKPLLIGGIDFQCTNNKSIKEIVDEIMSWIDLDYAQEILSLKEKLALAIKIIKNGWDPSTIISEKEFNSICHVIDSLALSIKMNSKWEAEYLDGIANSLKIAKRYPSPTDYNRMELRDSVMFLNFRKHKELHNNEKVILWTSNMHASKGFPSQGKTYKNLGHKIVEQYGSNVYTILFDNYSRHKKGESKSYGFGKVYSAETSIHFNLTINTPIVFFPDLSLFGEQMISSVFEEEQIININNFTNALIFIDSIGNVEYD